MENLTLPKFNVPPDLVRPVMSADEYVKWVETNWQRLRQSGQLDALCDAVERCPVDVRFSWPEVTD